MIEAYRKAFDQAIKADGRLYEQWKKWRLGKIDDAEFGRIEKEIEADVALTLHSMLIDRPINVIPC